MNKRLKEILKEYEERKHKIIKACICYCPTEAIEYGKKSIGKPRYHFEQLKMK